MLGGKTYNVCLLDVFATVHYSYDITKTVISIKKNIWSK